MQDGQTNYTGQHNIRYYKVNSPILKELQCLVTIVDCKDFMTGFRRIFTDCFACFSISYFRNFRYCDGEKPFCL